MPNPSIATIEVLNLIRSLNNDLLKGSQQWAEIAAHGEGVDPTQPSGAFKTYIDNTADLLVRAKSLLDDPDKAPDGTEWIEILTVENGEPVRHTVLTKRPS